MGAICRFEDEPRIRKLVPRCPLASVPTAPDESPCAGCPYNAAWPGQPTLGCHVSLPGAAWKTAMAELQRAAPALLEEVERLRRTAVAPADVKAALDLVRRWAEFPGLSEQGREAASLANAFLRAAQRTGEQVRLWE